MLLDGPRVLGVESLAPNGTTVRLQVRTAPTRQDDVARELRRRIQIELAGRGIQLGGLQRIQIVASEREARRVGRE
jgi:small-conductance mechanosensitive channel